jgi:DNA-directed RNA polymerase subunit RPC12/RpoP
MRKTQTYIILNRKDYRYRGWRKLVLSRDDYTCVQCGSTDNIQAHHIKLFSEFPELAFDVDNGMSLCATCHSEIHGYNTNPTGTTRKECSYCGKRICGKGKTTFCRSCAVRFSPKAIAQRAGLVRGKKRHIVADQVISL